MKRRVIASLIFDTQKARDAAQQDIEKDHKNKQTDVVVIASQDKDMSGNSAWILMVDISFKSNAKNDADDSHVKLKAKLKDSKVLRGEVTAHDCTHDDAIVRNCEETNFKCEVK